MYNLLPAFNSRTT